MANATEKIIILLIVRPTEWVLLVGFSFYEENICIIKPLIFSDPVLLGLLLHCNESSHTSYQRLRVLGVGVAPVFKI